MHLVIPVDTVVVKLLFPLVHLKISLLPIFQAQQRSVLEAFRLDQVHLLDMVHPATVLLELVKNLVMARVDKIA